MTTEYTALVTPEEEEERAHKKRSMLAILGGVLAIAGVVAVMSSARSDYNGIQTNSLATLSKTSASETAGIEASALQPPPVGAENLSNPDVSGTVGVEMDESDVTEDSDMDTPYGLETAATHSFELAYKEKRCSNYKINGQWTRTWTSASSAQACLDKCVAASNGDCDYFSFSGTRCLFNTYGCKDKIEWWRNEGWKTYQVSRNAITFRFAYDGKRCANYDGQRVWTSATNELDCFQKCQKQSGTKCNYFSYSGGTCLYSKASCSLENWSGGWKAYQVIALPVVSYEIMFTEKRCANFKIDGQWTRTWTSAESVLECKNKCLAEAKSMCDYFAYSKGRCLFNKQGCKNSLETWTGEGWKVYQPVRDFCTVSEDLSGRNCNKLWHDVQASANANDCSDSCCEDNTCGVWQYTRDNKCMREKATYQSTECGLDGSNIVAGARFIRDSTVGAVLSSTAETTSSHGGVLPPTPPPLPSGSAPSTAWPACWINSYGRGVGEPLSTCSGSLQQSGLLCYPNCKSGYYGVGPVCWEKCPSGWNDGGVFCNVWMHTIGAKKDCPWYDVCGLTFAKGCTSCPSGYRNDGCLCTRPPKHMTKSSYGRGAGHILSCRPGTEQNGLLCYDKCGAGYHGVGPVCWGQCPSSHPHKCGPLMCTRSSSECSEKLGNLAKNVFLKGGLPGLIGIADELCIPKCGDQRHMACNIVGQINDAISVCPLDVTKCPEAFKCLSFLGKRAEIFAKGVGKFLSGGQLKDSRSFFSNQEGLQGCVKAAGSWFQKNTQGCDVQKDGSFKEFAKCAVPLFKGLFLDNFSSPTMYISISGSAVVGIVGGGTSFDVNFGFDGTILFSYTKCNTLSIPDLSVGLSLSMGLFGNKNDVPGESYVLAAGAGLPGIDVSAGLEMTYSSDGERVIGIGAAFGVGAGLDLNPIDASCSNCDTKLLGCATTLDELGLGYLNN